MLNDKSTIKKGMEISLKVKKYNKIRNPGTIRAEARVVVSTTVDGYTLDQGVSNPFTPTAASLASVGLTTSSDLTSERDVSYTFTLRAYGPMPKGAFIEVELPADVRVLNENEVENNCRKYKITGVVKLQSSSGLMSPLVDCVVKNQRLVTIDNLFQYGPT